MIDKILFNWMKNLHNYSNYDENQPNVQNRRRNYKKCLLPNWKHAFVLDHINQC